MQQEEMTDFVKIKECQPEPGDEIIALKLDYAGFNPVTRKDIHHRITNYCYTDLETAISHGVVYWQPMLKLPKGVT